jgi:diadenosine tetraphosphate (Ap4A) HIT family hydrolase
MAGCACCASNLAADRGDDPWAVARLQTGYVRLAPTQYHRGATFFTAKACVPELHDLARPDRSAHLLEMSEVAAAVFDAVAPRKLNYEALGNGVPHLHWWLTPRHRDDPRPRGPIWEDLDFLRVLWAGGMEPDDATREDLRARLLESLTKREVIIEQAFV